jgi:hypothetical protein
MGVIQVFEGQEKSSPARHEKVTPPQHRRRRGMQRAAEGGDVEPEAGAAMLRLRQLD